MSEFQTGVVDSRTLEEMLVKLNSSLDLYEILLTTEYVLLKYDDSSDSQTIDEDVPDNEIGDDSIVTAAIDVTLNLNNDYFRIIRIDKNNIYKYSIISQVDFDNIVHVKEYSEKQATIDAFADRLIAIGTGKLKEKAESKYLLNGGKF